MAVIAVWKCDRDDSMFENKKDAEEYDKMLELAANITEFIEKSIAGIDEKHSEEIGLLLAQNKEDLAKACKGKPEVILALPVNDKESLNTTDNEDKVTQLVAS